MASKSRYKVAMSEGNDFSKVTFVTCTSQYAVPGTSLFVHRINNSDVMDTPEWSDWRITHKYSGARVLAGEYALSKTAIAIAQQFYKNIPEEFKAVLDDDRLNYQAVQNKIEELKTKHPMKYNDIIKLRKLLNGHPDR